MDQKRSLDISWVDKLSDLKLNWERVEIKDLKKAEIKAENVLDIIKYLDLTSLNNCDTILTIRNLVAKGLNPLESKCCQVASICIYPLYVSECKSLLNDTKDHMFIAAVDTSFPHGKLPINVTLFGIKQAILDGSDEIDIVVDRANIIKSNWEGLYKEIKIKKDLITDVMNTIGKKVLMKTIISVGDIDDYSLIYKASLVAMLAGSDFIKSSTGKEPKGTTLIHAYIMMHAIKDFFYEYEIKVGLKVAGGISKVQDAMSYLSLLENVLGDNWLNPAYFRIGASSLLDDIQNVWSEKFA